MTSNGSLSGFPFLCESEIIAKYVEIAIPGGPDFLLTYEVPEWAEDSIRLGMRVVVPFRKTHTVGVVVTLSDKCDIERIRAISDCPDDEPVFSAPLVRLLSWLYEYYACSPGDAFRAALPGGLGYDVDRIIVLKDDSYSERLPKKAATIHELLRQRGQAPEDWLKKKVGSSGFYSALDELIARKIARIKLEIRSSRRPRTIAMIRSKLSSETLREVLENLRGNARRQAELLRFIIENIAGEFPRATLSKKFGSGPVKTALDRGWIELWDEEVYRVPEVFSVGEPTPDKIALTETQLTAVTQISDAVDRTRFDTFLVWGVTGSGKTEVYLNAAAKAREIGKGVLVLVPEIALTPLLRQRFEERFPGQVAVLHSGLKPGERFDAWRRLSSGEQTIALGPRSAVFAPFPDLGLIVVDEEHEASYKQDEPPPYYNARDVAVMRGFIEGCPVVLGSATPSAESYHNAAEGKYKLLRLPERIPGAVLPGVRIVDMATEREEGKNFSPFSRLLSEKLLDAVSKGHRVMLFLNRRGFSSYLQCPDCGYIPTCDDCGIGMTYHRIDSKLRCHYCGAEETPTDNCPNCNSSEFLYRGHGTQRIEEELAELVPPDRIFRLDADAARAKGHAQVLQKFATTPGAVLVGTQMIAKGHDFPDVSLVGVLNADIGLSIPDFRSGERIFQLLTQVSGRAGRSEIRGEVIIQTYRPDFAAVDFSVNGDVESFFEHELKSREELFYPPFSRILRIVARGEDPSEVRTNIFRLTRELSRIDRNGNKYRLLGPAACPLSKLRGKFRWHLLLKTDRLAVSTKIVKRLLANWGGKVSFKVIVDPLSLL